MADFLREVPKQQKVDDNIAAKLSQDTTGKVGDPSVLKGDKGTPGADNSAASLPKMAIDTVKGGGNETVKAAQQFMPDLRNENAVTDSQRALGEMVNKAVAQAKQGDRKPAEDLSKAITVASASTEAHIGDLSKRVDAVKASMTKNTSMS